MRGRDELEEQANALLAEQAPDDEYPYEDEAALVDRWNRYIIGTALLDEVTGWQPEIGGPVVTWRQLLRPLLRRQRQALRVARDYAKSHGTFPGKAELARQMGITRQAAGQLVARIAVRLEEQHGRLYDASPEILRVFWAEVHDKQPYHRPPSHWISAWLHLWRWERRHRKRKKT